MFRIQVERGRPGSLLQFSGSCSNRTRLASADSSIRARCPNRESRQDLTVDERGGCSVNRRTSSFYNVRCALDKSCGLLREIQGSFFLSFSATRDLLVSVNSVSPKFVHIQNLFFLICFFSPGGAVYSPALTDFTFMVKVRTVWPSHLHRLLLLLLL